MGRGPQKNPLTPFGEALRKYCEEHGMTQHALAMSCGLSNGTLSAYVRRSHKEPRVPSAYIVKRLPHELRVALVADRKDDIVARIKEHQEVIDEMNGLLIAASLDRPE